jgi:hypothetical protein
MRGEKPIKIARLHDQCCLVAEDGELIAGVNPGEKLVSGIGWII